MKHLPPDPFSGKERIRRVLESPQFAPESLPPHRRDWLPGFLARTWDLARKGVQGLKTEGTLIQRWEWMCRDMLRHGVVPEIVWTVDTAHDGTAKEQRRGEVWGAQEELLVLPPDDVRSILLEVIHARDLAAVQAYPAWFGTLKDEDKLANRRARAVKFYPEFARWRPVLGTDEIEMMELLLDDPAPLVRCSAALVITEHAKQAGRPVGERAILRLAEGIADRDWIWSYAAHYQDGTTGCYSAALAAGQLGSAARAVLPAIRQLIADEEDVRDRPVPEGGWADGWVTPRLVRLYEAARRIGPE
jgi:hypothetical protein